VPPKNFEIALALGRGYKVDAAGNPVGICAAGQCRADLAAQTAASLELSGNPVYLAATAGREGIRRDGPTLGMLTLQYWQRKQGNFLSIVNESDHNVWGTLGELEWLERYIKLHFEGQRVIVWVVAAPRQSKRVIRMQRWFGLFPTLEIRVVETDEPPLPLYHEGFAYAKLALIKAGLRPVAEWFRRTTARPIKE